MRYLHASLLSFALAAAYPITAAAHASLDHSLPADGAVVETPPSAVRLWFSRAVEPSFSSMQVVDDKGERMDDDKPVVSDDEPELIRVGLTSLPPGKYRVKWRIVARDGHKAKGEFYFTLK